MSVARPADTAVRRAALRFGPTAVATPANVVTVGRVVLAAPLLWMIYDRGVGWWIWAGWAALACSDGLDGWLARRDGTTRSGAYLDPLADKVLTLGGFSVLAARGAFPWLPVGLMAAREVGISAYRSWAGKRGISMPAIWSGKAKTVCQLVAVGVPIWPLTDHLVGLQDGLLWLSVGLSLVSGMQLVRRGWPEAGVAHAAGAREDAA